MIKRPSNWNEVQGFSERQKLPLGAYVCKVKRAVVQSTDYGEQLVLLFDIEEGEFRNYYNNDYAANQNQDKKWRGLLKVWLPKDDGSEKDEWTKRTFKGMVTAFENSNPGYQFDWNEASLIGKLVGILFRNEEWEMNGRSGWSVRPFRAISVDSVRDESYTLPKEKPLKNKSSYGGYMDFNADPAPTFTDLADDGDLPF